MIANKDDDDDFTLNTKVNVEINYEKKKFVYFIIMYLYYEIIIYDFLIYLYF